MKPGIHPNYRYVVFQDTSSGDTILTRSTIETEETTTWTDGNEYPLAKVEISAFTHPFFTGQMKIVDTAEAQIERAMSADPDDAAYLQALLDSARQRQQGLRAALADRP